MEQLSLRHVYKMYLDGKSAVVNVSADLEPAEFLTLLGPAGAGKTSLLHLIAGTESVTRGQILWGDVPIQELAPELRPARLLAADYSLYPYLTVYENIAFRLKLSHLPAPVVRSTVMDTAKALEILHLLDRLPKALTAEEKLFTAAARLLARRPKLLLLDESMEPLSPRARVVAMHKLVRVQKAIGIPVIYATADVRQAEAAGGRALLMMDGCAVQCSAVEEMRCRPASPEAAAFLSGREGRNGWNPAGQRPESLIV